MRLPIERLKPCTHDAQGLYLWYRLGQEFLYQHAAKHRLWLPILEQNDGALSATGRAQIERTIVYLRRKGDAAAVAMYQERYDPIRGKAEVS